jgi:site-specific recombinase XerD
MVYAGPRRVALRARGSGRLEALTKEIFLSCRDAMQKDGHSEANINQTFKILARVFRIAADERLTQGNPIAAIKRLRGQRSVKGTFTPEQISKLVAAAPDDEWRALITLGYFTVHPELRKRVEGLPSGIGRAPMLPALAAKSGTGRSDLSRAFRRIMEAASIEPGIARERRGKAGHSVSKLSFHSLRHSFTSELARAGISPEIRQQLTGHADLASHKSYTHLQIAAFQRAIAALPALP